MKNNKAIPYVIGAALLVIFAGFSYSKFTDALTPYVPYEQAIASVRTVQVAGGLEANSSSYDTEEGYLRFTLVDTENASKTLDVRYEGVKPANFEDAVSIVAIGQWNQDAEEFVARDLLVKCPSKYQGLEDYETKSYSADESQAGGYETDGYGDGSYGQGEYPSATSSSTAGPGTPDEVAEPVAGADL